ncbi:PAS domain-containing sensor histidine kinase [Palleronia abyssalis]|uniref:Uncharacterized protein n=1 Tax=Palleronia abyssalis TaxID=1501240 RepID=A0A2R8BUK0_9RHOB|nr:ATP-binding protein [Palleronia abyssalis]SPJ23839.1 hypothetical protein PAA8504_01657 [Palleronia abyssalis]
MYHTTVQEAGGGLFDMFVSLGLPAVVAGRDNRQAFRIVRMNAAFRAMGLDMKAEDSGAFARIIPPRVAADLRRVSRRVLATGLPETVDKALVIDGDLAWWRLTVSKCDTADELVLITAQDITDLKMAALKLLETAAELREGTEAMAKLAAATAVQMRDAVAILEDTDDGAQGSDVPLWQVLANGRNAASRAMLAADGLVARIEAQGAAACRCEPLHLDQVCADIAAIIDPTARIDIVYPDTRIQADPMVLHVCLRNLIANAARYAHGMVEVSLYESASGDDLCLTVADDGPGFGKSVDPAHGVDGPHHGMRSSGPGAIVRLLSSVGGSLTPLPPRLGRGATMQMTLPGRVLYRGSARQ